MTTKNQMICLWSGYAFFVLYLLGFVVIAGFVPPPSPNLGPDAVVSLFENNRSNILLGMSICVVASMLYIPWSIALTGQMSRIEKARFPALSYMQMVAGAVGAVFFMISPFLWITIAFRNGHVADSVVMFNDFSWLSWLISWPFFFVQEIAFGICILFFPNALFPRWLGYLSVWTPVSMIPVSAIAFFKTGPFAWDGLFGIYLPLVLFAIWYNIVSFMLLKAIRQEAAGGAANSGAMNLAGLHSAS